MKHINTLNSMDTAPKDGTYIILFGESGYSTTPYRCEVCKYDAAYRPLQPWVTFSNDSFLDGGGKIVGWLPHPDKLDIEFSCYPALFANRRSTAFTFCLDSVWLEDELTLEEAVKMYPFTLYNWIYKYPSSIVI